MSIFKRKKNRIAELEAELDETEMSLDKLNGAIEDVLWFQGHDAFLRGLIAYVGETESPVGRPPELRRKDSNRIECVVWSLLVLMYGSFDDDPSKGEVVDKEAAIAHLHKWRDVSNGIV